MGEDAEYYFQGWPGYSQTYGLSCEKIESKPEELARRYNESFPNYPPLAYTNRWLYGMWVIGNDYKNKSSFHGAYPAHYLDRVMSMFPYAENILHLFSGSLPAGNYTRFDLVQPAEVKGDAHRLSSYFTKNSFDLILADPPYSNEDADKYGTPMVNRNKVLQECYKILKPDAFVVWLDSVYPMYSKKYFKMIGTIGMVRSTNHRFRVVCIFQKV